MTYKRCKKCIERRLYESKADMMDKLDTFLLGDRITKEQYDELVELLNQKEQADA